MSENAIEDNRDHLFLKLLEGLLVLELHPFSVRPVCPKFLWDPESCWPNLIVAICRHPHTHPQMPSRTVFSPSLSSSRVRTYGKPEAYGNVVSRLWAPGNWQIAQKEEGGAEMSTDNPILEAVGSALWFSGWSEMIWFICLTRNWLKYREWLAVGQEPLGLSRGSFTSLFGSWWCQWRWSQ